MQKRCPLLCKKNKYIKRHVCAKKRGELKGNCFIFFFGVSVVPASQRRLHYQLHFFFLTTPRGIPSEEKERGFFGSIRKNKGGLGGRGDWGGFNKKKNTEKTKE